MFQRHYTCWNLTELESTSSCCRQEKLSCTISCTAFVLIILLIEVACSRSPKNSIQWGWKILKLSTKICWLWTRTKRGSTSSFLLLLPKSVRDKLEKWAWVYALGEVSSWVSLFSRLPVHWAIQDDFIAVVRMTGWNIEIVLRMTGCSISAKWQIWEILQASMVSALPALGQTRSSAASVAISLAIKV